MPNVRSFMLILLGVLFIAGPTFAQSYVSDHLKEHSLHTDHSTNHHDHSEITSGDEAASITAEASDECAECDHCHCPMHCSVSVSANTGVATSVELSFARVILGPGFSLESLSYLSNPDLDGPFQPPRV